MSEDIVYNGGIPPYLVKRSDSKLFPRLRTQNLTTAQDSIIDGIGFTTKWREDSLASDASLYAEFTVPDGYYMALLHRTLNPSAQDFEYRVYPEGTYTVGTDKTDTASSFTLTRNLRQDSAFTGQWLRRVNVTTAPDATDFIIFEDVFGAEMSGNRSAGSIDSEDSFFLLNPNQTFLLEMYNGNGGTMKAAVTLEYALIPVALIPDMPA